MIRIHFPIGFTIDYRTIGVTSSTTTQEALKALLPKLGLEQMKFYALYKVLSNGEGLSLFPFSLLWALDFSFVQSE